MAEPRFVTQQARGIYRIYAEVAVGVRDNMLNLTPQGFQTVRAGIQDAITQIDGLLHQNNVRVSMHHLLGSPVVDNGSRTKQLLARLKNSIRVLCVLIDAISGGHGTPASHEEQQAMAQGVDALDILINMLHDTFSDPSRSAETE